MTSTHTLAFEIGVEEIPAFDLDSANKQLEKMVPAAFDEARIPYGRIEIHSSPRRLIVMAYEVASETAALVEEHKGPAVRIAFDAEGNLTKAGAGFARGKGVDPASLERRMVGDVEYVFATKNIPATPVIELLPAVLRSFITQVKWPRSQRWAAYSDYFVRPVRWIVALLDDEAIPLSFAGATSSNVTFGHRVLAPGSHEIDTAANLLDVVRAAKVVPTQAERERVIVEGVATIERQTGYQAELPAKTLLEVVNLSEYPTVLMGTFDEEFLRVPEEIIVDAMLVHQRYFPLYDQDHKLTNNFIIVSNGDPACSATIVDGNERVVRARLDDAKFFYEEDLKRPLEDYIQKLDDVVFQESLGTVKQKAERLVKLGRALAEDAKLPQQDAADLERACYLCKADLVTNAVVEFTSVQGIMGGYYALASHETPQVAQAISQHYQPRFAGDALPESTVGKLVALADKLDTICGLFAVKQGPTGSSDPFALRRSAIGIVNMLESGLGISLEAAIDCALKNFADQGVEFASDEARAEIIDFFITRTKVMLRDSGIEADTIDAVLAAGIVEPAVVVSRATALESARANDAETFADLATAYARANNLRQPDAGQEVDDALLGAEEADLLAAIGSARAALEQRMAQDDFQGALGVLAALRQPIDRFFENVMVMDEDAALRANRMKLLNSFVGVFAGIADFGKMAKSK